TKFEMTPTILVDEVLTPDSSRFGLEEECVKAFAAGKAPIACDKQGVRDYGEEHFVLKNTKIEVDDAANPGKKIWTEVEKAPISKLSPNHPEHYEFVHSQSLPDEII